MTSTNMAATYKGHKSNANATGGGRNKIPRDRAEEAVKRYLGGESVKVLAKYYDVSSPAIYQWIVKYKNQIVEKAKKANMSSEGIDKSEKISLAVENQALKSEVQRLKQKLFELMVDSGKL